MKANTWMFSFVLLVMAIPAIASAGNAQKAGISPWQKQMLDHTEDVRALMFRYKNPQADNGRRSYAWTDVSFWDSLPRSGITRETFAVPEYEEGLKRVVRLRPDSPFADDAALILARGQFYWHRDVETAITNLHKVAEDYPDRAWIAENLHWMRTVDNIFYLLKQGRTVTPDALVSTDSACLNYIAIDSPQYTADEAYMTIAGFYVKGYALPKERQVEYYTKIIERHAGSNRFAQDRAFFAARTREDAIHYWTGIRHEDLALWNLMNYYHSVGDLPKALEYGRRCIEKTDWHPFASAHVFHTMVEMEESLGRPETAQMYREKAAEAKRAREEYQQRR